MATAPPVPVQAAPQGAPTPGVPGGAQPAAANPVFSVFAQITKLAQQMAQALPATSPMAEEIQNQVRLALQKAIQAQAPQQQAPPI